MLLNDFEMTNRTVSFENKCPILQLTKTQTELAEKFTAAFYDAQNSDRNPDLFNHEEILTSFDENYFNNVETYEENSDYLLDFLMSKAEEDESSVAATSTEPTTTQIFDYEEFSQHFDQQIQGDEYINFTDLSEKLSKPEENTFFVPPPFCTSNQREENLELEDIDLSDLCESLSNSSFDLENFGDYEDDKSEILNNHELEKLPPVASITRNNVDFSTFLRHTQPNSLSFFNQEDTNHPVGHLVGTKNINNNLQEVAYQSDDQNQLILYQNDALLRDDPLLSSSNVVLFPNRSQRHESESQESEISTDCEEFFSTPHMQCKWEDCYQIYDSQTSLVRHIEKSHVELKRGEEFTCFWINCPRKTKPFNARYKLLIHMRVHSGEKPNKCPFKGCNKAFSRLENLKIHQRSHTGERPYLCQFNNCTKSFSNSSDRAKHQRTHFDTKPYACQLKGCNKAFSRLENLKIHQRSHTGERPYLCQFNNCTKSFSNSSDRAKHQRTHFDTKPYACQVTGCLKKYTDPSSLRKHVKNHTFDEQLQLKKKSSENLAADTSNYNKKFTVSRSKSFQNVKECNKNQFYNLDHSYTHTFIPIVKYEQDVSYSSINIKQDLKNKISEKRQKREALY